MNIGISQRIDKIDEYNEYRDTLDQRICDWVLALGHKSVPIPNGLVDLTLTNNEQPELESWLTDLNINGILISGGNDIGTTQLRDLTEEFLLNWAEKYSKPVLGICRGMQMMGVHAGAKLRKVEGHINARHQLIIGHGNINKLPSNVNSYHNFSLERCPEMFHELAFSEDGNLEAIVHKELPWEGWMWHPEREVDFVEEDLQRARKIFHSTST